MTKQCALPGTPGSTGQRCAAVSAHGTGLHNSGLQRHRPAQDRIGGSFNARLHRPTARAGGAGLRGLQDASRTHVGAGTCTRSSTRRAPKTSGAQCAGGGHVRTCCKGAAYRYQQREARNTNNPFCAFQPDPGLETDLDTRTPGRTPPANDAARADIPYEHDNGQPLREDDASPARPPARSRPGTVDQYPDGPDEKEPRAAAPPPTTLPNTRNLETAATADRAV